MIRNHFIIKGPVPPELFFDMEDIISFFRRQLDLKAYGVLIAFVAPFKFGKTSLLLKLYDISKKYGDVVPILLRLNIVSEPLHALFKELSRRLGVDVTKILDSVKNGSIGLHEAFEQINNILEENDKWVILFIDEFQNIAELIKNEGFLTNYPTRYIFEFVRGISETFRFGLVVSGSLIGELLDAIDVWHGRFFIFRPREFPREDSIKMLQTLFNLSGFEVPRDIVEYIAVAMSDHPYHMQLFGYYLVDSGRIDEQTLAIVKRKVEKFLVDYYEAKLLEAKMLHPKSLDVLKKVLGGIQIMDLKDEELEAAIKLERRGFIFRHNGRLEIFDPMFKRYLTTVLSNRPREKYIPEYTSEYIVARHLAHKEGYRNVLISYMSWGPFAIVILEKTGEYSGIGIQVKRTYDLQPKDIKSIIEKAKEKNLIPVIAIVEMPTKTIRFVDPQTKVESQSLKMLIQKYTNTGKQK